MMNSASNRWVMTQFPRPLFTGDRMVDGDHHGALRGWIDRNVGWAASKFASRDYSPVRDILWQSLGCDAPQILRETASHADAKDSRPMGLTPPTADMLFDASRTIAVAAGCPRYRRARYPGLDAVPIIDAENWVALRDPPGHVVVVGGSYIALEMSQALRRLGCSVTILQKASQLAEREYPDACRTS